MYTVQWSGSCIMSLTTAVLAYTQAAKTHRVYVIMLEPYIQDDGYMDYIRDISAKNRPRKGYCYGLDFLQCNIQIYIMSLSHQ